MERASRILVAGCHGLVGGTIVRRLRAGGFNNLLLPTHAELDLINQAAVRAFFERERPEYVFLAAAKVGGIMANDSYPAEFIRDNLLIQSNVVDAAYKYGVRKLLFLGSSCIYPKLANQPISEESLLSGPLEPTNQWYAVAKIAGVKLCQAYRRQYGFDAICAMPTNLYGPGDNFDLATSHVLPALIRKFHEAKAERKRNVTLWGSGRPRREFLYVEDLADALVFLMRRYSDEAIINVGVGEDISIDGLAHVVSDVVGFQGGIVHDTERPDGTPRKLLDISHLRDFGWQAKTPLRDGIEKTYRWYLDNVASRR